MRNILFLTLLVLLFTTYNSYSASFLGDYNGFDVSNSLISKEKIFSGGPPKDGIPAILNPKFESASEASWLKSTDLVTGVEIEGVFKAYPLRILVWHEVVNDKVGNKPIMVSYCPLCGSTLIFDREVDSEELTFGISGLLYQSDVLFYDHQNLSLWSQLEMKAISGPKVGTEMEVLPSVLATWSEWKKKHPNTLVLSKDTGFSRDYDNMPYGGYESSTNLMFPVENSDDRYHPKEKVLVVISSDNVAKAYAFKELSKVKTPLNDKVGLDEITIKFNSGEFVSAYDKAGNPIRSFVTYWFAWYTFRPDTLVFNASVSG
jgi:hypothetical protein